MRGGLVSLFTRSGLNWTKRFPTVATAVGSIPATDLVLDGEVISANERGAANFSQLQDDLSRSRYDRMVYYVFDILHLDGFDLRAAPLVERKRVLTGLLQEAGNIGHVLLSEHFEEDANTLFAKSCELGLEGIVSKLRDAPYRSERTEAWIKVKCLQVARFEVIGYKNGATSLYLGRREGKDLLYVGKAGTGFTNSMILELARLMKPITLAKSPLSKTPDRKNKIDKWAAPKILGRGRVPRHHDRRIAAAHDISRALCERYRQETARRQVQVAFFPLPCALTESPEIMGNEDSRSPSSAQRVLAA